MPLVFLSNPDNLRLLGIEVKSEESTSQKDDKKEEGNDEDEAEALACQPSAKHARKAGEEESDPNLIALATTTSVDLD